jgi:hypothetical protein
VVLAATFAVLWALYGVPLQDRNFDPSFYYAHIASPVIDGDLDFADDGQPPYLLGRTSTGLTTSIWSAGPAVLWAPFFLLAHALASAAQVAGAPVTADGESPLYLMLVGLGAAFWGWVGILCCYAIGRRIAAPGPALLAALTVWLASPLFQFMFRTSLYAHATTVALVSAGVLAWLLLDQARDSGWMWLLLGLLLGLAAAQRWQNALFALLVPFALPRSEVGRRDVALIARCVFLAAAGALVGFSPQMAVWWRLYGVPLAFPQGAGFLTWDQPAVWPLLFGSNRGLFVWQPAALIGTAGLLLYARHAPRSAVALLLVAALQTYLNSVVRDWWGGGGFGPRRFDWLTPALALGLAALSQAAWRLPFGRIVTVALAAALVLHQLGLAQAHYFRVMPSGAPFPIAAYDGGEELPLLTWDVTREMLQRPAFLTEARPTLWNDAPPLLHGMLRFARGAPVDEQLVASLLAGLLALALAAATVRLALALATRWATAQAREGLVRAASLVLSAVSLGAAAFYLAVGS